MRALTILETALYAEDIEAAVDFYTRVLGLRPQGPHNERHAFFRCGSGMLLIFNPAETLKGDVATVHGARGPGHMAFRIGTDEFDGWRARLAQHGVAIEDEKSWAPGALSLYFRDPAGNSIELTSAATWGLPEEQ